MHNVPKWSDTLLKTLRVTSIIIMKNVISTVPRALSYSENTIINPCEIANVFNKYFTSINNCKAKQNIDYSNKHFSENLNINAIILYLSNLEPVSKHRIFSQP